MAIVIVKNINDAIKLLKKGELLVYPTETSYALGADALNAKAVARVFAAKGRNANKALPIIVASLAMAKKYVLLSSTIEILAEQYWPGPLTLVLPLKKSFSRRLGNKGTVAIRVSGNATARQLSAALHGPIIATSANLSGQGNSYSLRSLKKSFVKSKQSIYLFSAGTLSRQKPSTLVRLTGKQPEILRQGAIHI